MEILNIAKRTRNGRENVKFEYWIDLLAEATDTNNVPVSVCDVHTSSERLQGVLWQFAIEVYRCIADGGEAKKPLKIKIKKYNKTYHVQIHNSFHCTFYKIQREYATTSKLRWPVRNGGAYHALPCTR